ncbi:micrococcal nuclease [Lentzea fradiae]|uniref:Micrococcal nuclease n=1 Tax=Lentzea fradiae TaxID=200378 RepID=A0A1G7M369_9PSEU|nr:thermonuclease family protein [Lentzea fradiae]SDF56197.1 micrococcal nuclease [Lentzea fradiae]
MVANFIGGALVVAAVGGIAMVALADEPSPPVISVERVIDGDTIEVRTDGQVEKIRLLNIDAPETDECLSAEATEHLARLLPAGTTVTLEHDVERTDRYGRVLAGVVKADGTLVNAEVARAGLAAAITVGRNARFYPEVNAALSEAVAAERGLHSGEIDCTLPAQVKAVTTAAAAPAPAATAAPAEWTLAADKAKSALLRADALVRPRGIVWTVLSAAQQSKLRELVASTRSTLDQREKDFRSGAAAAEKREAEAAEERRRAEVAAEEQRQRAAAEEQRRRDAAAQAQAQAQVQQQRTQSAPQQPADPYPGYNGPRCYAPGGKTWTPCPQR